MTLLITVLEASMWVKEVYRRRHLEKEGGISAVVFFREDSNSEGEKMGMENRGRGGKTVKCLHSLNNIQRWPKKVSNNQFKKKSH